MADDRFTHQGNALLVGGSGDNTAQKVVSARIHMNAEEPVDLSAV